MAEDITDTARFDRADGNHAVETADGMVVYQKDREKVHYLNPTAAMVYELCDGRQTVKSMTAFLQSAFDLPEPPASEVRECLENLVSEGVITVC